MSTVLAVQTGKQVGKPWDRYPHGRFDSVTPVLLQSPPTNALEINVHEATCQAIEAGGENNQVHIDLSCGGADALCVDFLYRELVQVHDVNIWLAENLKIVLF